MSLLELPMTWRARLAKARVEEIRSGLGGASVFRVEDASGQKQFLKIAQGEEEAKALHQEIERTSWLRSQGINVPEILDAIKRWENHCYDPPLCSTGITPLHHYYGAVRPSPAHWYFRPRGWSRLRLFPWHRRPGSHVPYQSLIELRAASMPDAAWAVSVHPLS
jgi:hypothetical protein